MLLQLKVASCFERCQGGNIVKTDRLDPFKLTKVANSITSLVHKVRDQIRSLTKDIIFPRGKSTVRASSYTQAVVKTEPPNAAQDDDQIGDNDETMGADYNEEPEADDVQAPAQMIVVDDDPVDESVIHLYNAAFDLSLAKPVCTTATSAVQRSANLLSAEGKESLKKEVKQIAKSVLDPTDPNNGFETKDAQACIEETVVRAQESTVASRLNDVLPTANLTGEIKDKTDPSQLQVIKGAAPRPIDNKFDE